jgi:hypothetical protein
MMQMCKALTFVSPVYGVNSSISQRRVGDIFGEKQMNEICESVND